MDRTVSAITTHVLDTARGRPAAGVAVRLESRDGDGWTTLATGTTDDDGRIGDLLPDGERPAAGDHRLTFELGAYFAGRGVESFYPRATIEFTIRHPAEHHHVPLLLSPHGYSTYRGS